MTSGRAPSLTRWSGTDLVPGRRVRRFTYTDPYAARPAPAVYQAVPWESPVAQVPAGFDELVPSWAADTPGRTWLEVQARVRSAESGRWGEWLVVARWCEQLPAQGGAIHRTSVPGQADRLARVAVDTVVAAPAAGLDAWQLRVLLARPAGSSRWPRLRSVSAVTSAHPGPVPPVSAPRERTPVEVPDLPARSQQVHRGHYPHWDGGGASWCSAAATAMVLGRWGLGPTDAETAWVDPPVDPEVDHTVRAVYDHAYGGAGNWAFNTAYAATRGLDAVVTRLRDLRAAEPLLRAGVPIVASVAHAAGELTGAGYTTRGHLLVVAGLTADGDVVCHDPASQGRADNAAVRIVYDRAEFERAWLSRCGGTVYLLTPAPTERTHPRP